MTEHESSRTLVKSAPELWAECSDAAALARHLGSVGEIRITRLEPETTVAWEGTAARGTVELEPAGWGTRVTLTLIETAAADTPPVAAANPVGEPVAVPPEEPPETQAQETDEESPAPRASWWHRMLSRLRGAPAEDLGAPADPPVPQPREPAEATAEAPSPAPLPEPVAGAEEPAALGGESALRAALDSLGRPHRRPYSRA